ncbi:MAG: hypothetical protein KGH98_04380 [Candidatus Micrarchaeota archaeon]|nr:hypothetical protein [Candidatus Micrarchaeota archaeon]
MAAMPFCNLCGKPATHTCGLCGKRVCGDHFDHKLGICSICKGGRRLATRRH